MVKNCRRSCIVSPMVAFAVMLKRSVRLMWFGAAFACGMALAVAGWAPPPVLAQGTVTAFVGATLVDGTGAAPVDNGVVLVRDGRIAAVGRAAAGTIPAGATQVGLRGQA